MDFLTILMFVGIIAFDCLVFYCLFRFFMFGLDRSMSGIGDIELEFPDEFAENERISQSKQIEWVLSR